MLKYKKDNKYLKGDILIAMPNMPDPRFAQTVIYVCAHNEEGAMGLVVNKPLGLPAYVSLLEQLEMILQILRKVSDAVWGQWRLIGVLFFTLMITFKTPHYGEENRAYRNR